MGFIEAMLNLKLSLKYSQKKACQVPQKHINSRKQAESRGPGDGTAVRRRTEGGRASVVPASLVSGSGAQPCLPVARPCLLLFCSTLLPLMLGASSNLQSSLKLLVKSSFLLKPDDFS